MSYPQQYDYNNLESQSEDYANQDRGLGQNMKKFFGGFFNGSSYQAYNNSHPASIPATQYNSGFQPINNSQPPTSTFQSYLNGVQSNPPLYSNQTPLPPSFNVTSPYENTTSAVPPYAAPFSSAGVIPPYAYNGAKHQEVYSSGWNPIPNYQSSQSNQQFSNPNSQNFTQPLSNPPSNSFTPNPALVNPASYNAQAPNLNTFNNAPLNVGPSSAPINPQVASAPAPKPADMAPVAAPTSFAPSPSTPSLAPVSAPVTQKPTEMPLPLPLDAMIPPPIAQAPSIPAPAIPAPSIPTPAKVDSAPASLPQNASAAPLSSVSAGSAPIAAPAPPPAPATTTRSTRVSQMKLHTMSSSTGNMLDQIKQGKTGLHHSDESVDPLSSQTKIKKSNSDELLSTLSGALDARFGKIRKQQEEEELDDDENNEFLDRSINRMKITSN